MDQKSAKTHAVADEVLAEQVRSLASHMPFVLAGSTFCANLVWIILYSRVNSLAVIAWVVLVHLLILFRVYLLIRFQRIKSSTPDVIRSRHTLVAATILSGILWASLPPMFIGGDNTFALIAITIFLIGMTAGSLASEAVYFPAFLSYSLPVMLSLSTTISVARTDYLWLGLTGYVFLAILVVFARNAARDQARAFKLSFDNAELLEQVREQKLAAEQADEAKSKFLAAASHDLRQPLHALGLYLEALISELDQQRQKELAARMETALGSLGDLFDHLLDISRLDAGIVNADFRHLYLDELLDRINTRYQQLADSKGLTLQLTASDMIVHTDPVLLERILDNLVSNAIHHTQQGFVMLSAAAGDDVVNIVIEDTGQGIAPENHADIFTEFHQLASPERDRNKGLGLGLAIVKRLSELLDHPLTMTSSLGAGTRFEISVPQGSAENVRDKTAGTMLQPWDLDGFNILVIDDEIAIRDAMRELLSSWGCRVTTADSMTQTESILDSGPPPDLIISDYRLREQTTGLDAIRRINELLGFSPPALLVTGDTAPARLKEASLSGHILLHKPINPAQLRAAIQSLLDNAGSSVNRAAPRA